MDAEKPLISVVLCTYNDESYISQTIESVLNQTYRNFEFIIWDDGSSDNTASIIRSYTDSRIRYFYHSNTGIGEAARLACGHAQGKYIARIDGDDICFPHRIEKELLFLEENPDYVLVSSSVEFIDKDGRSIGRNFLCTNERILHKSLSVACLIVQPMAMFRRDAYISVGGYVKIKQGEDRLLWSKLSKKGKLKNLPTALGQYRLSHSSLTHRENPYEQIIYEFCNKIICDSNISDYDIELYNTICNYSKKSFRQTEHNINMRKLSIEERIFNVMQHLIGKTIAEKLVFIFKNLYCKWQYRKL